MSADPIEFFGLDRRGFPRKLIGAYRGPLLIIGGGRNVWEDLRGMPIPDHVMCVNDIGMYYPGRIRHWYSNDDEQLVHWAAGRRRKYLEEWGKDFKLHSCFNRTGKINHWPFPGNGSSGLVATLPALAMGYAPIICAGMPFDDSGHFFDPPDGHSLRPGAWSNFTNETADRFIERVLPLWKGRVRFLSGRATRFTG